MRRGAPGECSGRRLNRRRRGFSRRLGCVAAGGGSLGGASNAAASSPAAGACFGGRRALGWGESAAGAGAASTPAQARPLRPGSSFGGRRGCGRRSWRAGAGFGLRRFRQRLLGGLQNAVGEFNDMALVDQPVQIRDDGGLLRRGLGARPAGGAGGGLGCRRPRASAARRRRRRQGFDQLAARALGIRVDVINDAASRPRRPGSRSCRGNAAAPRKHA